MSFEVFRKETYLRCSKGKRHARLARGFGETAENEKEVFAGNLDNECKMLVQLVGTKKIQTRVVKGVLSTTRMDIQSVGPGEMT